VQRLRRLANSRRARWEERTFVVEGPKLIEEALQAGAPVTAVYVDPAEAGEPHLKLAERSGAAGAQILQVRPGVLARAADTVTPQPIAALVAMVHVPLTALTADLSGPVLVCVGLQDPGNAGAVIRAAAASGAPAVVFCEGSVDPYNPKAVRGSAGGLFRVPVVAAVPVADVLAAFGRQGRRRLATVARGGQDYLTVDLAAPTALLLGSEAAGLPPGMEQSPDVDGLISIPMSGGAESLNVAMAATVLCFEAARQRRAVAAA
jgi:RNA methyltransferase, TrmH family